jgi:hypothetical protein
MTRAERNLEGIAVRGSDHLTCYNLYAEAYARAGYVGEVYGLPRHLFREEQLESWAEQRGALVKAIEDAALASASVFRAVGVNLPDRMPRASEATRRSFVELLAKYMPFDLVIDGETSDGQEVRVARESMCGGWGAVAGSIRYFAGDEGTTRATVEGTQLSMDVVRRHATRSGARPVYDAEDRRAPLRLEKVLEYFGFELERESGVVDRFPEEHAAAIRHVLADAAARGVARHAAVGRNRHAVDVVREVYRRSGGATPRLGVAELTTFYESRLANVWTLEEFRAARLDLEVGEFLEDAIVARYMALPGEVEVRGRAVPVDYDLEWSDAAPIAVARLRLPEKVARGLHESELPVLDRPVRFVVPRGQRGAIRAATLDELAELMRQPWMNDELSHGRSRGAGRPRSRSRTPARRRGRRR